jgi:DNA-binding transcriptional MerR regulator
MNITEVSKKFDISPTTLRYYERIGVLPNVTRTKSGIRDYSEKDCRWVEFIKCMRNVGMSIEVLIEYVPLFQQGDATKEARKELLVKQRDQLVERIIEIKKVVDRLNAKIERLNQSIVTKE